MFAASQLPGRGPTDVDVALYLHVNQKSDDDDDEITILKLQITQQQECFLYTLFRNTAGTGTNRTPLTMYRIVSYHNIHPILQSPFLQGMDLSFMKILHIFYNLMLNRSFDAMFWGIYSVCWSVHRLKLTSNVWTLGWSNSVHSITADKSQF